MKTLKEVLAFIKEQNQKGIFRFNAWIVGGGHPPEFGDLICQTDYITWYLNGGVPQDLFRKEDFEGLIKYLLEEGRELILFPIEPTEEDKAFRDFNTKLKKWGV